jgi:AraC-like DNA-binding protein
MRAQAKIKPATAARAWLPPIYLYRAGRESVCSRRYHNDVSVDDGQRRILIKHTLSGSGVLYVGKKRLPVPEGHAFVIERPGPYIYCFEDSPQPWEFEFLSISINLPSPLLPPAMKVNPVVAINHYPEIEDMFTSLVSLRMSAGFEENLLNSAAAYRLFLSLVTISLEEAAPVKSSAANSLKQLLDRRFRSQASIASLARQAGFTPEASARAFMKEFGLTPVAYINNLRIRHACRLLEESTHTLKRIARECGFTDANYFGRVFRKCVGVTPGEYRDSPDPLRLWQGDG